MGAVGDWMSSHWAFEVALLCLIGASLIGSWWMARRRDRGDHHIHTRDQLLVLAVIVVALIFVIVTLPVDTDVRNSLLGLFGLLLTAVLGLSATTHVGNGLAGVLIRSRKSFKPGDFLRSGDHFGRVTDIGLLHTEIQTEDRDLTLLPNHLLATEPFTVVRATGTIVHAEVSLGYDVPRAKIREALLSAATHVKLKEPFVLVTSLGDFSVVYRLGGLLENPRTLISARSALRGAMLDGLHDAGIEIVSPTFMNQRQIATTDVMIPERQTAPSDDDISGLLFDKAELAESVESLKQRKARILDRITVLEDTLNDPGVDNVHGRMRIEQLQDGLATLDRVIAERETAHREL